MHTELVNRRLTVIGIWLLLIAGGVYLFTFEPGKNGFFPLCPFRALTGFQCPGCGATRAMHQLLHGHMVAAFELNPLFFFALPLLAIAFIRHTTLVMQGITPRKNILPASAIYALFFIVLSFWIFRNTPFYPFVS